MLVEVRVGEVGKSELVRKVFYIEVCGSAGGDVAKPRAVALILRKRDDRACEERDTLDGVMKCDVEMVGNLLFVGVEREGEAQDSFRMSRWKDPVPMEQCQVKRRRRDGDGFVHLLLARNSPAPRQCSQ